MLLDQICIEHSKVVAQVGLSILSAHCMAQPPLPQMYVHIGTIAPNSHVKVELHWTKAGPGAEAEYCPSFIPSLLTKIVLMCSL
jgi:hypothetical protein